MNTRERGVMDADLARNLRALQDALRKAWDDGTLPASVIPAELARETTRNLAAYDALLAEGSVEKCFCDEKYPDSNRAATCGDCPRDYKGSASSEGAEADAFVGSPAHVAVWEAIAELVEASGGRNGASVARMSAVPKVERAIAAIRHPQPAQGEPESGLRDAYEGAREDLLDWKGRAQRAEARLRNLGWAGVDASEPPSDEHEQRSCEGSERQGEPESIAYWNALNDANQMCRSAFAVAKRAADGDASANWPALRDQLEASLLRQFAVLYPACFTASHAERIERLSGVSDATAHVASERRPAKTLAWLVERWRAQAKNCREMAERIGEGHNAYMELLRDAAQYEQCAGQVERCHIAGIRAALESALPRGLPAGSDAVRQAWRAAITLANNICVQESDRENANDGDTGWIDGTAECAKRIREFVEPADAQLVEMLTENGAAAAISALTTAEQPSCGQDARDAALIADLRRAVDDVKIVRRVEGDGLEWGSIRKLANVERTLDAAIAAQQRQGGEK